MSDVRGGYEEWSWPVETPRRNEISDGIGVYWSPLGLVEWVIGQKSTLINTVYDGKMVWRRWPRVLCGRVVSRRCRELLEDLHEGA